MAVEEDVVVAELQDILSKLYFKYGKDNEVIRLSCVLDKFIVKKQKEILIKKKNI